MRLLTGIVVCVLIGPSVSGQQRTSRAADEAAIRGVVREYMAARDRRDANALGALFTADADQQTTAGVWRRGRAEIVPGTLESSDQNAGTRTIRIETIRFLSTDTAIADGPYEISAAGGAAARRMWTTIVLTRAAAGWQIAAIRNMVPTAAAVSGSPLKD